MRRNPDAPAKIVVIGAGVGGLAAAAILARAGLDVTVLEAHIYPGGCAGTFYHQKYRFDAGATLAAGFYPGGPMDLVASAAGMPGWPARPDPHPMQVHLPDSPPIPVPGGKERWEARLQAFGADSLPFWSWQETTAEALWELALRLPAWPPQDTSQLLKLGRHGIAWATRHPETRLRPSLIADAFQPVAAHLPGASDRLRQYVDAQLLISAQTTSRYANALYAASALDLPRRGVVHLAGGMGAIAQSLANAVLQNGGRMFYRQEAQRILFERGQVQAVQTQKGEIFPADLVIANLTPWNVASLFEQDQRPFRLRTLPKMPRQGWGAFMLYVGVDAGLIGAESSLHHQVVVAEPLGEGNSVFLSVNPAWDDQRAPQGRRAITISTHSGLDAWWQLYANDRASYESLKSRMVERMLRAAEVALPGLREAVDLILPGTPVTFQRFTRRAFGWVGGFPQTSLLRAWGPRLAPGVWMVGDSIFPGQSTAAVAMGGLRVARDVLGWLDCDRQPASRRRLQAGNPSYQPFEYPQEA